MVPFYIIATMDDPAVIPKFDEMIGEVLVTTEEVQMLSPAPCPGHDFAVAARVCTAAARPCRASLYSILIPASWITLRQRASSAAK